MIYIAKSYTYYAWCKIGQKLTIPPSTLSLCFIPVFYFEPLELDQGFLLLSFIYMPRSIFSFKSQRFLSVRS